LFIFTEFLQLFFLSFFRKERDYGQGLKARKPSQNRMMRQKYSAGSSSNLIGRWESGTIYGIIFLKIRRKEREKGKREKGKGKMENGKRKLTHHLPPQLNLHLQRVLKVALNQMCDDVITPLSSKGQGGGVVPMGNLFYSDILIAGEEEFDDLI
jgi:hypothetical protein